MTPPCSPDVPRPDKNPGHKAASGSASRGMRLARTPRRGTAGSSAAPAGHGFAASRAAQVAVVTVLRAIASGTPACCAVTGMSSEQVATLALYAIGILGSDIDLGRLLTAEQRDAITDICDRLGDRQAEIAAGVVAFLDGQLEMYELEAMLDEPASEVTRG
jgi:hypothetical protein